MRIVKIPKGHGKFRTIYVPNREQKAALRAVKSGIERRVKNSGAAFDVIHGFVKGRSPITNAATHIGHEFTLTMDLKDFFDSVTAEKLRGKLANDIQQLVLVDGAARQGLPTSPAVANLAAIDIDRAILKFFDKKNIQAVYTRYADDLTFSYDDESVTSLLLTEVKNIVTRTGFKLADQKTHLYRAKSGRRIVTGVAVDDQGIHPTREMKRRLRAAKHRGNKAQVAGLTEWCKLKPPHIKVGQVLDSSDVIEQVIAVAKAWNLPSVSANKIPDKGEDVDLGEGCRITGDPVLMLGMSTFTTGWRSCMRHPDGGNRRGSIFWMHLEGTRIAAFFSEKTGEHGGVVRPLMRARALVHQLEDGTLVYDRVYGGQEDANRLVQRLEANGIVYIKKNSHTGKKIVGHAPSTWKAYFDSVANRISKATDGRWRGRSVRSCYLKWCY